MTLQLLHSEFPYIWGKFYFLFYQSRYLPNACPVIRDLQHLQSATLHCHSYLETTGFNYNEGRAF
jgi:hypothetical protein